ncbi:Lipoprotein signal peptidase [Granulibacter bethesdensis]|uniref:signal peptidase II n=1 Tax=Granulibacter bethesdensis TaxID=364410 RepID=UPI00090AB121|nr:signal peptidase II [Granulibacter bethesdensis]APH56264.1 Lipoprotein signal peptidase [Granulibacter bethesdensis]
MSSIAALRRAGAAEKARRFPGFYMPIGILAALIVLLADQGSKWFILETVNLPEKHQIVLLPVLNLTMVWNRGVTFGLLNGFGPAGIWILGGGAILIVAGLLLWMRRAENRLIAIALGMIGGGAIGNVIDRFRFGAVVDFIHAHIGDLSWFVFNVADAAIVIGVALLIIDTLIGRTQRETRTGEG